MFKSVIKEEIQVPAHIDYLGELRNFVTKAGRKHGFSDTVINAFKLSIDEAATNIIKHAYRDWEGNIKMRVIIKKNSMTVLLIDQGKYFDPSTVKDPDLKRYVDIGKKGGLGIFIIRKLIDEIDYRHTEEGNELRLTKYRESVVLKKKKIPTPSLPGSLKTRYSAVAAGILTGLVVLTYTYFFFHRANVLFKDFVKTEKENVERISSQIIEVDGNRVDLNTFTIGPKIKNAVGKHLEFTHQVFVVDTTGYIVYCTDESKISQSFSLPKNKKIIQEGLFYYKNEQGEGVYSFFKDVIYELTGLKLGTVYYEFKESYLADQIWALRYKDLQLALIILLFGYAGIIVLVYIILNPFRKLANWIKELGSGDVKDEIDFEANDEVGEIAKAFSEISDTLRDSQRNLAEQERIQKEMQLAQDIQQTLLPAEVPKLEGYEISSFYEAAKEVGGDYYDFIEVDKDTLGIVVADVSGKGVPGSLIMTMIRTALRTEARSLKSASEVLARVNEFVVKDMKRGMFVTLFYVIIDSRRRRINYASAGHNPMILFRKSTNKTYYLNPRGFPVGISLPDQELFKKSIESDTIQLAEDDILILYTDGITEAMNSRRELFGEERFLDVIRHYGHLSTEDFIQKLRQEIHTFTEGYEQNDDITLVAIKEKSSPEKIELKRAQRAHKMILQGKNIRDACEECGITVYAYYNKYKKIFEEEGVDAFELDETIAVEAKHLSIEEKTKIYDIIKKHPEYGAKRISEELNTEKYGFTVINENKIYDELVRSRLNTRQLREAFIARSGRKRRMKPPGTPMLTLDGKIIIKKDYEEPIPEPEEPLPQEESKTIAEDTKEISVEEQEKQPEMVEEDLPDQLEDDFYLQSLMSMPLEDLLKKKRKKSEIKDENILEKKEEKDFDFYPDELDETQLTDIYEPITEGITIEESDSGDADLLEDIAGEEEAHEFENDISFGNIWDEELEEDVVFEEELAEEAEKRDGDQGEEKDILESDLESIEIPSSIDIEDILTETEEEKLAEEDFDFIDETPSFAEDLLGETGETESISETDVSFIDVAVDLEEEDEQDEISDFEITTEEDLAGEASNKNEQQIEAQDDFSFGFSDLLEELSSEINLFEETTTIVEREENELANHVMDLADEIEREVVRQKLPDNEKKENPRDDKNLLLGLKYYREQKYKAAVNEFLKVIQKFPDFKEAHSILGNAYYHLGEIDEAIRAYKTVRELDPNDTDSYENTGVIYANQGRFDEAIEEWEKVIKIDPSRKDIAEHIREAKSLLKNSAT